MKKITLTIVFSSVLILFLAGTSIGKYKQQVSLNVNGDIAKPILEVVQSPKLNINQKQKQGEYEFTIKNANQKGEVSQVDLQYQIQVIGNINSVIGVELWKQGENIKLQNDKTDPIEIKGKELIQHEYKLKVKGEFTNDIDLVTTLFLKVEAELRKE